MSLRRTILDTLIITYVAITAVAFFVTMTHRFPEHFLKFPIYFSYGMMAPYQGASAMNRDLVLIGYDTNGTATVIQMDRYFPGLRGERNARKMLDQISDQSHANVNRFYSDFLKQIRAQENREGRIFSVFELWREVWPKSSKGYGEDRVTASRELLLRFP